MPFDADGYCKIVVDSKPAESKNYRFENSYLVISNLNRKRSKWPVHYDNKGSQLPIQCDSHCCGYART